jgi:UPF0755 protein
MRRQNRRRRWALAGMVLLGLLLVGSYIVYRVELLPAGSSTTAQAFEVKSGTRVPDIATALESDGLIRSRNAFISYLNFHDLRTKVKAGTYALSPDMSAADIAHILVSGKALTNRLIVPEGYRLAQIQKMAAQYGIAEADFAAAVKAPHAQSFLATKPATVDLEGYLFPDSYEIDKATTATSLVDTMLATFGERVGPEYVQAFAAEGLTLHQGLTLASVVEREVNIPEDRPIVAQIFLKRFKTGMALGSDVTVHYAADLLGVPFNLDLNSPYNTRKYPGLPPGPICNPGLSALDAVAHPATTDYLFFLTGKDGKDYFAKTYAEHQQNIDRHL